MSGSSRRTVVVAFISNLGIVIVKLAAFLITGSASLFSEVLHSTADTTNQGLLMVGLERSKRKGDAQHPFGYATERYLVAFVVAIVLFGLGCLASLYEGITKLVHPHPVGSPLVGIAVLVASLFLEGLSFRNAKGEAAHDQRANESIFKFAHRTKVAEIPLVLFEDLGAIAGLSIALIGLGASAITGNDRFDAAGSLLIGILLGAISIFLGLEVRSLLIGESADPLVEEAIRVAVLESDHIRRVIYLMTMHLGPTDLLVAIKVAFDGDLAFSTVADEIDLAEVRLRAVVPFARLVFVEPDIWRENQDNK